MVCREREREVEKGKSGEGEKEKRGSGGKNVAKFFIWDTSSLYMGKYGTHRSGKNFAKFGKHVDAHGFPFLDTNSQNSVP